ncbi:MAG TPA: PepSY domain-containing protein [Vicinamibacteria bacterium]|nr:PepSY domain-containing protein [Vicinamibacteria bacterium]
MASLASQAPAAVPREPGSSLEGKAFFKPELSLSTGNVPLADVVAQLPNRRAWEARLRLAGPAASVYLDSRSGTATNIVEAVPLIPGTGVGNRVTLASLGQRLGRAVTTVDAAVVADAVLAHVRARHELLGIDVAQLGTVRAVSVTPELWQVSIPQQFQGIPVRHGRIVASVNHGNLLVIGTEAWGNVALADAGPRLSPEQAQEAAFEYVGGRSRDDVILDAPALEIVPMAPPEHQAGERFTGPIGAGYAHRLVWVLSFQRPPEPARWEALVDAATGEVLALQDQNLYAQRQVVGGVYPHTSTEICPSARECGTMRTQTPMPFVDTGFPAPNDFANSAGVYDYPGGVARTRLRGRFVRMVEGCVPPGTTISETSTTGALDLGGANGQHDCESAPSGGDTPSSRTTYYEANRIAQIARGYLPQNAWLQSLLTARTNVPGTAEDPNHCNAFWDLSAINFFSSGSGCRNTGEIASVVDHEWGHGLDDNDTLGMLSSPSEAYADIAAIYRTQDSCIGRGFFETRDFGCGQTADGRGFNFNEDQAGGLHCATDCSGVRDADWARHADSQPDTALGFVCQRCNAAPGPCGREVHCAAAPVRQAAWDLVTRDLTAPPFGLDSQTAFIVGNKLFYQGSGNVGQWYGCACGAVSNGCGVGSGYVQWLAADDNDGTIDNGTPHMTAIFNAFNRHGIACSGPSPHNGSCGAIAASQPTLTVTPGVFRNTLSWTAVDGATRYWVFRTEGHAGCDYGKALIAEVTSPGYVDTEVATGRTYHYNVVAAEAASACFGRASSCASGAPTGSFTVSCSPTTVVVSPPAGSATSTCTVQSTGGFTSPVSLGCVGLPSGASCAFTPSTLTPLPGTSAQSTLTVTNQGAPAGPHLFKVRATTPGQAGIVTAQMTLVVGPPAGGDLIASFDPVLQAPSCGATVGRSCDSRTFLAGRALLGPEPNQPNTIADSCADGTEGEGSNDRIRVSSSDGLPLTAGRTALVTAWVTARTGFEQDAADFFVASDANQPTWVHMGTVQPAGPGPQSLSLEFRLPAGALQAVRVQFRSGGTSLPCAPGPFDDRDDLAFAVAPPTP